jgi:NAD(P)-dependent dehydrogenase (short-subunit alcohol dehydrogenase family)
MSTTVTVVTGACGGLGFEFCRRFVLQRRSGTLVLACRNVRDGELARAKLLQLAESLSDSSDHNLAVQIVELDLSRFASVHSCATRLAATLPHIDVLLLNAGVMFHRRERTVDSLDLTLQTNFYGHFLLARLLQPQLDAAPSGARVVAVSSVTHWLCDAIPFEDLELLKDTPDFVYKERVYCISKLLDLLFIAALQRRFAASNSTCIAVACHPGWSKTMLMEHPASESWWYWLVFRLGNPIFAQSAEAGSLPLFEAAFGADVRGGDYIGPDGCLFGFTGANAVRARRSALASDPELAERVWKCAEQVTSRFVPKSK